MNDRVRLAAAPAAIIGIGDTEPFSLRLAQTIAWCAPRSNPANPLGSLRYDQLRPRTLEIDRTTTIQTVVRHRATYVPRDLPSVGSGSALGSGRLLAYFPDAELSDGAAEQETGGYFDVNNAPPWDTWVGLFDNKTTSDPSYRAFLVAWVPPGFLELVARGIYVNPEGCLAWLADVDTQLGDDLRTKQLLR